MNFTVEAVIDPGGAVRLLEPVDISRSRRALVTIFSEESAELQQTPVRTRVQIPIIEGTPGNVVNPTREELDTVCLGGNEIA